MNESAEYLSMDGLPFTEGEFDVIWSEGAVYNMGFEAGVSAWRRFRKPGGKLIVSQITWLSDTRPPALQAHWDTEDPEIDVASAKIGLLERHGHSDQAKAIVDAERHEIALNERFRDYYSYGQVG